MPQRAGQCAVCMRCRTYAKPRSVKYTSCIFIACCKPCNWKWRHVVQVVHLPATAVGGENAAISSAQHQAATDQGTPQPLAKSKLISVDAVLAAALCALIRRSAGMATILTVRFVSAFVLAVQVRSFVHLHRRRACLVRAHVSCRSQHLPPRVATHHPCSYWGVDECPDCSFPSWMCRRT